jgi:hypothetical protein
MSDPALNLINKKNWNKTKPIMICMVLNFLCLVGVGINRAAGLSSTFFIIFLLSALLFTILAIHYAWELETKI